MPALDRNVKVTCENCGTSVTKQKISRHKSSCSGGIMYCPKCPSCSTKSRDDLIYHFAKKHSVPKLSISTSVNYVTQNLPVFFALRQHKNTQHGTQIGFGASNTNVEDIVGDVDGQSLREELETCKHFLTDTEMENGRHRVFNFGMSSLDMSLLNDKLDYVFKELKRAAKVNLAFGFVLKNVEEGSCRLFMLTTTIWLWRGQNLCVQKLIWLTWKTKCRNWILLIFYPRKSQYKVVILQTYKFNIFCFVTQRCTHGLWRYNLTWTVFEKPQCELSYFWEIYETTLQWQPLFV